MMTSGTHYHYGTTNGSGDYYRDTMGGKSYCPKMSWETNCDYDAICAVPVSNFYPWYDGSCPKGWGRNNDKYSDDTYSVSSAQGCILGDQIPVYGYVTRYMTRYRTVYYTYISTRVAKA